MASKAGMADFYRLIGDVLTSRSTGGRGLHFIPAVPGAPPNKHELDFDITTTFFVSMPKVKAAGAITTKFARSGRVHPLHVGSALLRSRFTWHVGCLTYSCYARR